MAKEWYFFDLLNHIFGPNISSDLSIFTSYFNYIFLTIWDKN